MTYVWDGRDAYGRPVQGSAPVIPVRMGYTYQPVLAMADGGAGSGGWRLRYSFASPMLGRDLTVWPENLASTGHFRDEPYFVSWATWRGTLSNWTELPGGLGGWSVSPRHGYDTTAKVLYRGDGTREGATPVAPRIITSLPGQSWWATAMAIGADGSIYTASDWAVMKGGTSGQPTPVAGGGLGGCQAPATGVPARSLCFSNVADVVVGPDELVYFAIDGRILGSAPIKRWRSWR